MYAYINSALSICKIYKEMERERERESARRGRQTQRERMVRLGAVKGR